VKLQNSHARKQPQTRGLGRGAPPAPSRRFLIVTEANDASKVVPRQASAAMAP